MNGVQSRLLEQPDDNVNNFDCSLPFSFFFIYTASVFSILGISLKRVLTRIIILLKEL